MELNNIKQQRNIDYKKINVKGKQYLIDANPKIGFNFPYTLFIPDNISKRTSLIVEGANSPYTKSNIQEAVDDIKSRSMDNIITSCNNETNYPILVPCFPRIYINDSNGNLKELYTHMLTSESLRYKGLNLERIDNQLIYMIEDAIIRIKNLGIEIDDKIIIDGFSSSAKFANRFAILHPEKVKLLIAGGCSGVGILPLKNINHETLLYPIGCGDIEEITEEKIELFKKIKQFYYMGENDNNDPFEQDENGNLLWKDCIEPREAQQLNKYFGKEMMPTRWERFQKIYKELGVNATFKTYKEYGHNPTPAINDIKNLLKREIKEKTL